MNLSGKHFEYAGVYSSNPLGDDSVSLIFAHIDTKMFDSLFGAPEYSSAYSGSFGRRVLTGTNRSESCFEFEQEIVSEKGGIPLNKLRTIEQWLFSQETYCKLYIAEDEEDPEDVSYADGKKRLYLNCMFTEPQMLTYSEGKVGWKVKVVCDAPWVWQDEQQAECYHVGETHTVTIKSNGNPSCLVMYGGNDYYIANEQFTVNHNNPITFFLYMSGDTTKNGYRVNGGGIYPVDASSHRAEYRVTSDIDIVFQWSPGDHAYANITTKSSPSAKWFNAVSMSNTAPESWGMFYKKTSDDFVSVESYQEWVNSGRPQLFEGADTPRVVINTDVNDYIYPDKVDIYMAEHSDDTTVILSNATDDENRLTQFIIPSTVNRISIGNDGTVTDGSNNSIFSMMTERNFPRLLSRFLPTTGGVIGGLSGVNSLHIGDAPDAPHYISKISVTFKNRRFLS